MNLELEGMDELQKALQGLARQFPEAVLKGCTKTGFRVERKAKQLCPVDTGNLRSSIRTNVDKPAQSVVVSAGGSEATAEVKYAAYVNFGTHTKDGSPKMYPRPFFTEGCEEVRNLPDDVAKCINEVTNG